MSELFNNENIGVAAVLAAAFVYGFMKQGFYIGFICNSLFDWDFVCGVYES